MLNKSSEMTDKEAEFLSLRGEDMKMATDHLIKLSREEQLLMLEEQREKDRRDQEDREGYQFDRGMERGIEKGLQEGRQEGIERGMEKGIERGRQEVILNMLRKGTDISFISEITGCSEEEIQKLKK